MERFTERDEFGNADIIGVDGMGLQCNLEFDEFNKVTNALNKLAEYEDLEEQGKLLITPHAVGDTVYTPIFDRMHDPQKYISEAKIEDVSAKGAVFADDFVKWEDFGKYEFLTKEEAEAALKEL